MPPPEEFFFPFDDQPTFERYLGSVWESLPFHRFDPASLRRVDRGPKGPLLRRITLSSALT